MIRKQKNNELNSSKKLKKLCKKRAKILFYEKLWKIYKSKTDIVIEINNKILTIELKDDRSYWSTLKINTQIKKYEEMGKQIFKNYYKTILVSPLGRYGMSFKDLDTFLSTI